MQRKKGILRLLISPLALLYGFVTGIRNMLFDMKILPSEKFPIPIICVGNLSVGGTGKTPFTEYLTALLLKHYRVATLSRGYKRRTKGFRIVEVGSYADEAGDEPCQLKQKYPDAIVAVDANRRRGINKLLALPENERPQVIILDDAMQHRYVTPSLTVMLTDYNNMYYEDHILPVGDLRESVYNAYRADIVIVTKCRNDLKPIHLRLIEKSMSLMANQKLFFSEIQYLDLQPVFKLTEIAACGMEEISKDEKILLITGIASPHTLINKIRTLANDVRVFTFPDHHDFVPTDIQAIDSVFKQLSAFKRRIICTEKDATRLRTADLPADWKPLLFYAPIRMQFLFGHGNRFDDLILKHVFSTININK
ncbi:MAG: tetraacyldisaccharide 4'-kinase [Tannerella sp.]|jgi:tetraacyldisaccharide 4'-kinase|nr:tetraacyldisaccharide 4'-kinase [Tannerella sp.]